MRPTVLPRPQISLLFGAAWAVVIALLFLLALDAFVGEHHEDSSIYLYVGKGILEGEIPYLDRWDNKGPLHYLVNAAGLLLHEEWGIWAVQAVFLLVSAVIAYLVCRKSFGTIAALFALALFLVFYRRFASPGNFTEQYGLLFQFLALLLFLRSQEEPDRPPSPARSALLHLSFGVLGAAAFLIRPNLVAIWLIIGLYWCFLSLRGASIRKLAWSVIGGGCTLLAVALFFIAAGAWEAMWSALFTHNAAYSATNFSDRAGVALYLATEMFPISLIVIAAWCVGVTLLFQNRESFDRTRILVAMALILFPLEIVSLSLSGYPFRHYFLSFLPVATLLLAFLAWWLRERLPRYRPLAALLFLVIPALYVYVDFDYDWLRTKYVTLGILAEDSDSRLAAHITKSTEPSDSILVWGNGPRIYLLAERDAPSRYFFHFPLIEPHYTTQAMLDEFFTDLEENKPALIVDSRYRWIPPLERSARADFRINRRRMHDLEDFKPLFDFVEANYAVVGYHLKYTVFALRRADAGGAAPDRGELIIESEYEVYLNGRTVTLVKAACGHYDAANRFILHVVPVDNSVIDGRAHANMDFYFFEGDDWHVGEGCVVSRELPDYPVAAIRAGQYNADRTAHEWLSEYRFPRPD